MCPHCQPLRLFTPVERKSCQSRVYSRLQTSVAGCIRSILLLLFNDFATRTTSVRRIKNNVSSTLLQMRVHMTEYHRRSVHENFFWLDSTFAQLKFILFHFHLMKTFKSNDDHKLNNVHILSIGRCVNTECITSQSGQDKLTGLQRDNEHNLYYLQ